MPGLHLRLQHGAKCAARRAHPASQACPDAAQTPLSARPAPALLLESASPRRAAPAGSNPRPHLIVGAGVAGLTLAYQLLKAGEPVVVCEKQDVVGGLARSFHYDGFTFDIGPKRFHTEDPEVLAFLHEVLQDDSIVITRSSKVHLFDRYFDWPLTPAALFQLPLPVMLRATVDLLRKHTPLDQQSFSEYTKSRYGQTLYQLFFKPYTEKFLRIPCETVHVDWAKTGINRAVIDKRVRSESIADLVRTVLLPKPVKTEFLYPSYGGFGTFARKLEKLVTGMGGPIFLQTTVATIAARDGRVDEVVLSDGQRIPIKSLIWSGNLLGLARLLGVTPPPIGYLSTVLYNVGVQGPVRYPAQWIYYGSAGLQMSRVTVTTEIAPYAAPPGATGLCAEVTCLPDDPMWQDPETLVKRIAAELVQVRLIAPRQRVLLVRVEKVVDTYPIYDLNYRAGFAAAARMVKPFRNLKLLGRTGAFWYNNSDHSMKMALDMSRHLLHGKAVTDKDELFRV